MELTILLNRSKPQTTQKCATALYSTPFLIHWVKFQQQDRGDIVFYLLYFSKAEKIYNLNKRNKDLNNACLISSNILPAEFLPSNYKET